ncbi:hypothetical protein FS837_002922 [Tulasnella sp. UAMH 9824]|nr:hypothetical protein FS837_002922 [Tulasnella sp. UAMH 9824]
MSTQAETVPTLTYTEATAGDVDLSTSQASVTIQHEGGDSLDPLDSPANEQYYSVVQPGMRITELQPELDGELTRPPRADGTGGYADVYRGIWTKPDGTQTEVAIYPKLHDSRQGEALKES